MFYNPTRHVPVAVVVPVAAVVDSDEDEALAPQQLAFVLPVYAPTVPLVAAARDIAFDLTLVVAEVAGLPEPEEPAEESDRQLQGRTSFEAWGGFVRRCMNATKEGAELTAAGLGAVPFLGLEPCEEVPEPALTPEDLGVCGVHACVLFIICLCGSTRDYVDT